MSCGTIASGPGVIKYSADESLHISSAVPVELGSSYTGNFDRYTYYETPNGGKIHIVAQADITNEQIVRVRNVLSHFLTNYAASKSSYAQDKSAIANKMADNGAILILLNGQDDGSNPVMVQGQPLYFNEVQVEGGSWYMDQNYEHRDASYEEIFHLVHDNGIGVDGIGGSEGAAPEFQTKIRAAQVNGLDNKLWGVGDGMASWIRELKRENSLSQEYFVSVLDSYYGLWGAWTGSETHGMWGGYIAKTRGEITVEDPQGDALIKDFLHPYLTYQARLDSSLSGSFSLSFNSALPYTYHSQYLKDICLTGTNPIDITVNELDNVIIGNEALNKIVFSGNRSDYLVKKVSELIFTVEDMVLNRDGKNTVESVEVLSFLDGEILISSLVLE